MFVAVTMTSWTRELAMELQMDRRDEPPAPILALVDALDEMIAWVDDQRSFIDPHEQAWRSCAADLDAARKASGSRTRGLADDDLAEFDIKAAMERARAKEDRSTDLVRLRRARATVVSDEGVQAMWADVVAAAHELEWAEVDTHRRNLVRAQAACGHEVTDRFRVVAGILQDALLDVEEARSAIGESTSSDFDDIAEAIEAKAELSEDSRVALASKYLLAPFHEAHFIVWLAVDRATMSQGMMPIGTGSVTFYDSRYVGDALKADPEERSDGLPKEIRNAGAWAKFLPAGEFTLLARVDLGVRRRSFAARDARMRLLTLLAPAERFYPADWNVLPGYVVFRDGRDAGVSVFEDVAQTSTACRLDGVSEGWLEHGAQELEPHLVAAVIPELSKFLQLIEWDAAHRDGDSLTRVLLAVRTIETIAASHVGNLTWQALLKAYHSGLAWSRLKTDLNSTVARALYSYDRHPEEHARIRLREIFQEVISHEPAVTITKLDVLLDRLPEMCELWDTTQAWESGVMVERAVRIEELRAVNELWAETKSFEQRLQETSALVQLQQERLARVRNAAQHGGPILDESVRSVVEFADRHRQQIIADLVDGLVEGRDCSSTLAAVKRLAKLRAKTLASTASPRAALSAAIGFE